MRPCPQAPPSATPGEARGTRSRGQAVTTRRLCRPGPVLCLWPDLHAAPRPPLPSLFPPSFCSPAGTWQDTSNNALACKSCTAYPDIGPGSYRTGDATPENNECKPVPSGACGMRWQAAAELWVVGWGRVRAGPGRFLQRVPPTPPPHPTPPLQPSFARFTSYSPAGYKLKDDSHSKITPCEAGRVAFWENGDRVPADGLACAACSSLDGLAGGKRFAHTYAPRKGEPLADGSASAHMPCQVVYGDPSCGAARHASVHTCLPTSVAPAACLPASPACLQA